MGVLHLDASSGLIVSVVLGLSVTSTSSGNRKYMDSVMMGSPGKRPGPLLTRNLINLAPTSEKSSVHVSNLDQI